MCAKCLGHLESWEEFKQICVSSNKCVQEYLNQLIEETPSMLPGTAVKIEDEVNGKSDEVFNDDLAIDVTDNDELSSTKSPVLITVTCTFVS